jgi:DNA-directed RNA polymerase specialized sigma24 family protein
MVELYGPLLRRRSRLRIRNDADARDVVQDVFATVLTKIEGFTLPEAEADGTRRRAFRPWLYAILNYKIL